MKIWEGEAAVRRRAVARGKAVSILHMRERQGPVSEEK